MQSGLKKNLLYIGLSTLSGLLLAFSWPYVGNQSYLIFVALIPLLYVERSKSASSGKFLGLKIYLLAYLTFVIFNYITTWWIKLASPGGMILAVAFNSLFMAGVFLLFHYTKRFINDKVGYAALIIYWLAFEYLHINWSLSWIWLTFGNVFARDITLIQWYEYTGTLGGSLWVLSINIMLFTTFISFKKNLLSARKKVIYPSMILSILVLPMLYSLYRYRSYVEKKDPIEILLVQPNIDPYNEKFGDMSEKEQIDRLIQMSATKITPNTELIFGPETAFPIGYWEHNLENEYGTILTRRFLQEFPGVKYIVGLSTLKRYKTGEESSPTARLLRDNSGDKYDYFNSVMQVEHEKELDIYRKSKLVLGVETMPFSGMKFLESLAIELGGSAGSLGIEGKPVVFESVTQDGRKISVAPAICYESIYSEYLTEFVQKGANIIAIVTNDGWWGDTPGYWQHLAYGQLRAIEMRRSVARCANTGISAFINQKGDIIQQSEWWVQDVLRGELNMNDELTIYASYGDYIGRIASFFAVLMLAWTTVKSLSKKLG